MTLKKLLKSKLPITAIFERLCIEKKVRQIFSVFSTCSFLILMSEIDPGCKQMLFLEHAQSDEWDSLLVKNYYLPNVICVAEVELYQRGEPI